MLKVFSFSILIAALVMTGGCKKSDGPANKSGSETSASNVEGQIEGGETYTNEAAKIDFQLPAGWILETDEQNITAFPKEGGFLVQFYILNVDNLDKAKDEALTIFNREIHNLKTGEIVDSDINGLKSKLIQGNSEGVRLVSGIVDAPADNISVLIAAWGSSETVNQYEKEVNSIIKSIAAAK
ncbi:MAG: hypothetical protein J0L60_10425 [Ignavibacteria bacterium]|nr:hypothetical protein [Ignavibacteria bacterium]